MLTGLGLGLVGVGGLLHGSRVGLVLSRVHLGAVSRIVLCVFSILSVRCVMPLLAGMEPLSLSSTAVPPPLILLSLSASTLLPHFSFYSLLSPFLCSLFYFFSVDSGCRGRFPGRQSSACATLPPASGWRRYCRCIRFPSPPLLLLMLWFLPHPWAGPLLAPPHSPYTVLFLGPRRAWHECLWRRCRVLGWLALGLLALRLGVFFEVLFCVVFCVALFGFSSCSLVHSLGVLARWWLTHARSWALVLTLVGLLVLVSRVSLLLSIGFIATHFSVPFSSGVVHSSCLVGLASLFVWCHRHRWPRLVLVPTHARRSCLSGQLGPKLCRPAL